MPYPEPPTDDPSLLRRGAVVGPWQVGDLLGEGATSRVYLVSRSGVQAALKVLKIRSPGQAARLEREARLLREVRHPNIVASYETIDVDGLLGLVMEYIPGPTLADYLRRRRMSIEEATLFGSQLIQGIAAAHRAGLVHRDLKPANVLVDDRTASLTLKITDFGLARALGDDATAGRTPTVGMLGTPQYLAPEQLKNASSADARADLFSLGAILYEMVVGQPAFDGDLLAVLNASAVGSFRRPSEVAPGIPGPIETAIVSALEPDRRFRVPDADTLLGLWSGSATSWDMPAGFPSLEISVAPAAPTPLIPEVAAA
ncbi:MAG: serine/threonine-protein kinase, partial [Myxococcota bacterium]